MKLRFVGVRDCGCKHKVCRSSAAQGALRWEPRDHAGLRAHALALCQPLRALLETGLSSRCECLSSVTLNKDCRTRVGFEVRLPVLQGHGREFRSRTAISPAQSLRPRLCTQMPQCDPAPTLSKDSTCSRRAATSRTATRPGIKRHPRVPKPRSRPHPQPWLFGACHQEVMGSRIPAAPCSSSPACSPCIPQASASNKAA